MKKRGFALIAAIFFIIIVGTIAVTTLSTASMTARDTVNLHAKEQAFLLAQSATEFAIMAMQTHHYPDTIASAPQINAATGEPVLDATGNPIMVNRAGTNCLEQINLTYPVADEPLYNITVNLYYVNNALRCTGNNMIGATALADPNQPARHMAVVDVTVQSTNRLSSIPIRYNRRTLQKP